jgi:small multidrug resistance pump
MMLFLAIITEIFATTMLKAANSFTKLLPTVASLLGYACSFYFLAQTLKSIPLGIAYAIWSGLGIVCISILGYFIYHQKLDLPAIIGIIMIIGGCVIINLFSHSVVH